MTFDFVKSIGTDLTGPIRFLIGDCSPTVRFVVGLVRSVRGLHEVERLSRVVTDRMRTCQAGCGPE